MDKRPELKFTHGSGPVDLNRVIKDADEIAAMRRVSEINDAAMESLVRAISAGITENELSDCLAAEYSRLGAGSGGSRLICFGANCADPHHGSDNTKLEPGMSVLMDNFVPAPQYWCDMTRTVFYGSVSVKQREVYELVKSANETAEAMIRPGVTLAEIDRAARNVIENGGYGPNFTHRLGHGIGLECHEPPDVSAASDIPVKPGMVFSVEPGVYLPGQFGVRIEDLVLVTDTGCEILNKYPKDLLVIN